MSYGNNYAFYRTEKSSSRRRWTRHFSRWLPLLVAVSLTLVAGVLIWFLYRAHGGA